MIRFKSNILNKEYFFSLNIQIFLILVIQIIIFKDVIFWIFSRLNDNSDEISSITSLSTLLILFIFSKINYKDNLEQSYTFNLNILSLSFILYFFAFLIDIAIIKAFFAFFSFSLVISFLINKKYFDLKILGLLVLSLPILTSIQFFIGYPLRFLVTNLSSLLLRLGGLNVFQDSTCLTFNQNSVCVDAPCSGIQMLLTGFYLCFVFAFIKRLNNLQTILLLLINIFVVIFVNIFRATALFYTESGILFSNILDKTKLDISISHLKEFSHQSIGIVSFIFIALLVMMSCDFIKKLKISYPFKLSNYQLKNSNNFFLFLITIFLLQSSFLFINNKDININSKLIKNIVLDGKKLKALPFSELEKRFFSDFPGKTGRFTDGEKEVIIREIYSVTRKLHPASDCYKGIGYKIDFLPIYIDKDNNKWNSFKASKNNNIFIVYERIYDNLGNSWTDVSTWFWSSLLGKSKKPWTSIVYAIKQF